MGIENIEKNGQSNAYIYICTLEYCGHYGRELKHDTFHENYPEIIFYGNLHTGSHAGRFYFVSKQNLSFYHIREKIVKNFSISNPLDLHGEYVTFWNNKFLSVGGGDFDSDTFETIYHGIYELDLKNKKWTQYMKIDIPRTYHSCVVMNH